MYVFSLLFIRNEDIRVIRPGTVENDVATANNTNSTRRDRFIMVGRSQDFGRKKNVTALLNDWPHFGAPSSSIDKKIISNCPDLCRGGATGDQWEVTLLAKFTQPEKYI